MSNIRFEKVSVTAFVDWQSQFHVGRLTSISDEMLRADRGLSYVASVISRILREISEVIRFEVSIRIYHGWHRGFEPTARKKALVQVAAGADFQALSLATNVVFRSPVQLGDWLMSGRSSRSHARLTCHLPNTLRKSILDPERLEEKMVDTSIASDIVDLAHRERNRWLIVLGEDDDLLPPIYVADGIRGETEGKVFIVRTRTITPFFKISDLSVKP